MPVETGGLQEVQQACSDCFLPVKNWLNIFHIVPALVLGEQG